MKITSQTWELLCASQKEKEDLFAHAETCGVPLSISRRGGFVYGRTDKAALLMGWLDGLMAYYGDHNPAGPTITADDFRAMCEEYAAANTVPA